MIGINRDRIPVPSALSSSRLEKHKQEMAEFFSLRPAERRQRDFRFRSSFLQDEVESALLKLFYNKCAYCESRIGITSAPDIDHFRPKIRAVDQEGNMSPDHYWWLAYEWLNLYPSCQHCNRAKGTRFPIRNKRAAVRADYQVLEQEGALLLDPCSTSPELIPEKHLIYKKNGEIASGTDEGLTTIEVFDLNRSSLVQARKREYESLQDELRRELDAYEKGESILDENLIDGLADPAYLYAGMRRQFITQWHRSPATKNTMYQVEQRQPGGTAKSLDFSMLESVPNVIEQRDTIAKFNAEKLIIEDYSLTEETQAENYFKRLRLVEKIKIHNFRVIRELTFDLTKSKSDRMPWFMLLGENGRGKSSVLQAVALALVGEEYRNRLLVKPANVLRHRCKSGYVEVYLSGATEPIKLEFFADQDSFKTNTPEPKILLLGYGATRLLSRDREIKKDPKQNTRVVNLFDPRAPFINAEEWLLDLPRRQFDDVARSLKKLLLVKDEHLLKRERGEIKAYIYGNSVKLEDLSAGYQSVLAMTVDIMAVMLDRWGAMEVAEGIVLIDEIGAHLHPRWKMRIVDNLRRVFPRVQFIVSTHHPLCLRGLENGEVVVMDYIEEPDSRIVVVTDLPSIKGMRVDQILTSEHFGLNSTLDPEIEDKFDDYYALMAIRDRTADEEVKLQVLTQELEGYRVMGKTSSERLFFAVADKYLAQKSVGNEVEMDENTRDKLIDLWGKTITLREE